MSSGKKEITVTCHLNVAPEAKVKTLPIGHKTYRFTNANRGGGVLGGGGGGLKTCLSEGA